MKPNLLPERRALVQHLFGEITLALEIAHSFALTGQSSKRPPEQYARCARCLQAAAQRVVTLAAAVDTVLSDGAQDHDSA
jgi:hypothetical protein